MRVVLTAAITFFSLFFSQAHATSLIHRNLNALTDENEFVVDGQVLKTESYWNQGAIWTDVTVKTNQVLKGIYLPDHFQITLLGGTVGEITSLVIDGAQLDPGKEYILFLHHEDFPGAPNRLTIPDHIQGVFQVSNGRATSQAAGHSLIPDSLSEDIAPGGEAGLALGEIKSEIMKRSSK
jgi:hypothetical protein